MKASTLGFNTHTPSFKKKESSIEIIELESDRPNKYYIDKRCIVACTLTTFLTIFTLALGVWYFYEH